MGITRVKNRDLHVRSHGNVIEVPCLAGADVCRRIGTICVEIVDGRLHSASWGDLLEIIEPGDDMMGWGDLDGPGVNISGGAWYVTVPASVIAHLRAHYGLA
ncbi:MAG TPA: hypothetical protein VMX74_13600 [Pirellulales bacterium]|nr:hypothetical protein [Pirellulales bacterium]